MTTLYDVLGLASDATPEEIKRAYREKAMDTHPDIEGGSAEAFGKVKRAYDTLGDPKRRAYYDRTGKIEGKPIDHGRLEIFQTLSFWFDEALTEAEKTNADPAQYDFVQVLKRIADRHIESTTKRRQSARRRAQSFTKLQKRFHKTKGDAEDNVLEAIIAARLASFDLEGQSFERDIARLKAAKAILADYTFEQGRTLGQLLGAGMGQSFLSGMPNGGWGF